MSDNTTQPYAYENENIKGIEFHNINHTASWETYSRGGHAHMELSSHVNAKYLAFCVSETGEKSTREVMVSLDAEQVANLRKFLNNHFAETD